MRALIIGATGYVGGKLATELLAREHQVACMVRDAGSPGAAALAEDGCELRAGDLTDSASLGAAVAGIDVVFYLAHLMAGNDEDGLVAAEEAAAGALAAAAKRAGVERVVFLGALGDERASEHLHARHRTAAALAAQGPPLVHLRAAMIVGGKSESYVLLKSLIERLPMMPDPEWLENRTQPIGADDVVEYLAEAASLPEATGREIQIGGPEAMTYREMLEGMAEALGAPMPSRMPTPAGVSPKAAGRAAGAITRGDAAVAEEITAGLATDTLVDDPSGMELFSVSPDDYRMALGRAIEEDLAPDDGAGEAGA